MMCAVEKNKVELRVESKIRNFKQGNWERFFFREYHFSTDLKVERASPSTFSRKLLAGRRDSTCKGPGLGKGLGLYEEQHAGQYK